VIVSPKGVSDKSNKSRLWFSRENTLNPSFSKQNLLNYSNGFGTKKGKVEFIDINTISLDDFFSGEINDEKIDFIKIDVEGAEALVINGAERILARNPSVKIIMEFCPHAITNVGSNPLDLIKKLKSYNFEVKYISKKQPFLRDIDLLDLYRRMDPNKGFDLLAERKNE